jgi:hypothetical protein
MKPPIARISLVVAIVLLVSGSMVLCDCSGLYALAAGFAGVAVISGVGRLRGWAATVLLASVAFIAAHAFAKL